MVHQSSPTMVRWSQFRTQGRWFSRTGLDEIQCKWCQLLLVACVPMVGSHDYVQVMVWDVRSKHQGVSRWDCFIFRAVNRENPADRYIFFSVIGLFMWVGSGAREQLRTCSLCLWSGSKAGYQCSGDLAGFLLSPGTQTSLHKGIATLILQ